MNNNFADNERAVWILKTQGPQPLCKLAEELKVTMEGARFQLLKLANEGLVQATTEAKGRGRPKQIWALTEAGNARFPDRHQDLALRLLCNMNKTLPTDTMNEVLEATAQSTLEKYEEELKGITGLENRVSTLADIRNREGYMAEYINEGKSYLLIENHCPIQAAASCCSRFCRSEQEMFSTILGKQAKVERVEHILDGQRRCVYRITGK
ncbi:transcriptional regulator [Chitinophaga sp. CC14]|uniref:helix-turn-helix transcriptional regulator n=1 Tax=Chitinophaga TaxID=79328 RepID=UPI000DBA92E3|nr:metalloregulator ArsR/SmtB family transcription factor [Chitinophaga ginsengisegetis]MDR6570504.1 putative ArsR family transcriptional regulator [Chitinophaga ginsengisegetis]MDR6650238.1 putative ArsR family transcriptional regulator [Chitinophaga ginsengisegetis]MDR6656643.1 putative ArsR family transcriptional regulator [Chitinophaga ginsengisegetis]